jgi:hypothetical protein
LPAAKQFVQGEADNFHSGSAERYRNSGGRKNYDYEFQPFARDQNN